MATIGTCTSGVQTIYLDPALKLVTVLASAQSSGVQSVSIADSTGKVVFKGQGASSAGGTYTVIAQGTFVPSGNGNYTVTLTANSGILYGYGDVSNGRSLFNVMHSFGSNDGGCAAGDMDFNDLFVQICGFYNAG